MIFDCDNRHGISREARLLTANSVYAERDDQRGIYALRRYRSDQCGSVHTSELCVAPDVDGFAAAIAGLRNPMGASLELRLRPYHHEVDRMLPFLEVGRSRKILEIGSPYSCLNLGVPAVWPLNCVAQRNAALSRRLSKDDGAALIAALLPYVKR